DRFRREREPREHREDGERYAGGRGRPARALSFREGLRGAGSERDRRDGDLVLATRFAGKLLEIRRRGIARGEPRLDLEPEFAALEPARDARGIERDDVPVGELPRTGDGLAPDPQVPRLAARLHEEHTVEEADRKRAVDAGKPDVRARIAADRDGQRLRSEMPREAADVRCEYPVRV